ncbi:MAG: exodeoxyribonuclease VII small subunit [Sandaracinaceae bacterium]
MADAAGEGPEPEAGTFEELLGRLEGVVERLEGGDLPLEEALAAFEEGVRLSRAGAQRLDEAERRVEELLTGDPLRFRPLPDTLEEA